MSLIFDLISDLHIESWATEFDWRDQATSALCVIAGDVCRDRDTLRRTLEHLGQCYHAVFYIDGNDEHYGRYSELPQSYRELAELIRPIPNVVYLQNNVVILDDVAIMGTNGWWSWDFDPCQDTQQCLQWWCDRYGMDSQTAQQVAQASHRDRRYLTHSVARLQDESIKHIVVVTHTVPYHKIISHDIDLHENPMFNVMGSDGLISAVQADYLEKLHTWCFGHYHGTVDQIHHGVRFVNNCRGRDHTNYKKTVFNPLRVVIDD